MRTKVGVGARGFVDERQRADKEQRKSVGGVGGGAKGSGQDLPSLVEKETERRQKPTGHDRMKSRGVGS